MWRKPEENQPQSALDALPSTVPSPQRPAAAAPVSSNAPACVTQGIKVKGEFSGREDLVVDGESKEKFTVPMAFSLSVPTPASTRWDRFGAGQTTGAMTHGINEPQFSYERPPRPLPRAHARREKNPSKKRREEIHSEFLPYGFQVKSWVFA